MVNRIDQAQGRKKQKVAEILRMVGVGDRRYLCVGDVSEIKAEMIKRSAGGTQATAQLRRPGLLWDPSGRWIHNCLITVRAKRRETKNRESEEARERAS